MLGFPRPRRAVDIYLIQMVFMMPTTELPRETSQQVYSRGERGMPGKYVRLDIRQWRRGQAVIVVTILQLRSLGRMNR